MIDKIKHFALTSLATVHDEEAMSALELMGRIGAKTNEAIEAVNENTKLVNETIEAIDGMIEEQVTEQTAEEFDQFNKKINALIEGIPEGDGANVRPGSVKNGSIVSGMLGMDMLELRQNHYIVMAGRWGGGNGYYDPESLNFIAHDSYTISDPIPVEYGQYYKIHTAIFGGLVYPVALFDNTGRCVGLRGAPGNSTWDLVTHEVAIDRGDVTHMRVLCGNAYISAMRVELYTLKDFSINEINLATSEHWHMHAKNRTDTVTDRAQIKCSFKLPENFTDTDEWQLSFSMAKYKNIAPEGLTVRVFASISPDTYDKSLPQTAAGYRFLRSRALDILEMNIPTVIEKGSTKYLALFMDFIAEDPQQYMDVWMLPPVLERVSDGLKIYPVNPQLHGALATDHINVVRPGAAMFGTYGKKILGIGDSLMKGNTLDKHYSWFNIAAGALDMDHYNCAINGMPIAPVTDTSSVRALIGGYLDTFKPDYVLVQGGANDKRLNVDLASFRSAIYQIIELIREKTPKAKILFATNWHRTDSANNLSLFDWEYVDVMIEECEAQGIPFVNNYTEGLDLTKPAIAAWADEGTVSTGTPNIHFSIEANEWIAEKYIHAIAAL